MKTYTVIINGYFLEGGCSSKRLSEILGDFDGLFNYMMSQFDIKIETLEVKLEK